MQARQQRSNRPRTRCATTPCSRLASCIPPRTGTAAAPLPEAFLGACVQQDEESLRERAVDGGGRGGYSPAVLSARRTNTIMSLECTLSATSVIGLALGSVLVGATFISKMRLISAWHQTCSCCNRRSVSD